MKTSCAAETRERLCGSLFFLCDNGLNLCPLWSNAPLQNLLPILLFVLLSDFILFCSCLSSTFCHHWLKSTVVDSEHLICNTKKYL